MKILKPRKNAKIPDVVEIKPCPCCGSKIIYTGESGNGMSVQCRDCRLQINVELFDEIIKIEELEHLKKRTWYYAIKLWNRRVK